MKQDIGRVQCYCVMGVENKRKVGPGQGEEKRGAHGKQTSDAQGLATQHRLTY